MLFCFSVVLLCYFPAFRLPPPPPAAASPQKAGVVVPRIKSQPNPGLEGLTLGEFNLKTGEIVPLRPFSVNLDNTTATAPMDAGMASFNAKTKDFWFACNVEGNMNQEAVCSYPATKGEKASAIKVYPWSYDKTYTMTSIDYSKALKGVVVLAQSFGKLGDCVVKCVACGLVECCGTVPACCD